MILTELLSLFAVYLRLVMYPLASYGLCMLAIFQPMWKTNPASKACLGAALYFMVLETAVLARLVADPHTYTQYLDYTVTPALVVFTTWIWVVAVNQSRDKHGT